MAQVIFYFAPGVNDHLSPTSGRTCFPSILAKQIQANQHVGQHRLSSENFQKQPLQCQKTYGDTG